MEVGQVTAEAADQGAGAIRVADGECRVGLEDLHIACSQDF